MARFFGTYEHSLDIKGRIILPARFRASFSTTVYASQYLDRCLALWTPEEFDVQMREMELAQARGKDERNRTRFWANRSAELELDRQGRIAIPTNLREYARLETAVLVTGSLNRVELWNPAEYAQAMARSEELLAEGEDLSTTTGVAAP